MSFYIYRLNTDSQSYLNYEIGEKGVKDILKFSTSGPNKGIFQTDSHNSLQVMYDGKWFYVIIEDGKFIINNDPHNLDPKLSFLEIEKDDKKKKNVQYVLAIFNKDELNFVNYDDKKLYHTLNGVRIYQARVINLFDFLWHKETRMTPSSSLFSLSVFLAMALLVI